MCKRKLGKKGKTAIAVVCSIVVVFAVFIGSVVGCMYRDTFNLTSTVSKWQEEHLSSLAAAYSDNSAAHADTSTVSPDVSSDDTLKINEVRFLATHNSYKSKETSKTTGSYVNDFVAWITGVGTGGYSYYFDTLSEQFNHGIYSIELDATAMDDGTFIVAHQSAMDVNSSCYDFESALKEIKMWSDYNAGHLPITILLEPKSNSGFPRTDAHNYKTEDFNNIDALLKKVLGDTLVTPDDFLHGLASADYENFAALRNVDDWPTLNNLKGKVIVILHPNDGTGDYIMQDDTLKTQAMFPAVGDKREKLDKYADYCGYALCNEPEEESEKLAAYGTKNFIIRTRIDIYCGNNAYKAKKYRSASRTAAAIGSAAQIISTDYPPATEYQLNADGFVYLDAENRYTVTKI